MRIGPPDLQLLRDAWNLRGQVIACALVVAGGINSFVLLSSVNRSLAASHALFYETHRFADVFADLVRAPEPVARRLAEIPGRHPGARDPGGVLPGHSPRALGILR